MSHTSARTLPHDTTSTLAELVLRDLLQRERAQLERVDVLNEQVGVLRLVFGLVARLPLR